MKHSGESVIEGLSSAQRRLLEEFEALLLAAAVPRGLVATSDAARLRDRHIVDSLRVVPFLAPGGSNLADLGSGAGLPGIPVAIARPDCPVTLIEAKARRVAFLELAIEELGLANVRVLHERAERATIGVDVVLARAIAPPLGSWELAAPNLAPAGALLYYAGRSWTSADAGGLEAVGVHWEICAPASFQWQGPIVRMARRTASP